MYGLWSWVSISIIKCFTNANCYKNHKELLKYCEYKFLLVYLKVVIMNFILIYIFRIYFNKNLDYIVYTYNMIVYIYMYIYTHTHIIRNICSITLKK